MFGAATMNLGGRAGTKFGPCFGTEPPVVRKKKNNNYTSKMSARRGVVSFFDSQRGDRSAYTHTLPNYNSADAHGKYNSESPDRRDKNVKIIVT
jgi:hypothetical protein